MVSLRRLRALPLATTALACLLGGPAASFAAPGDRLSQTPDCLLVENVHSKEGQVKSVGIVDTRLHLYVYVPRGTTQFTLGIFDQDDDSPAAQPSSFTLYTPDGKVERTLDAPRDNAWSDYDIQTAGHSGVWRLSVSGPQDLPTKGSPKAANYFMARTQGAVDLFLKPEPVMRVRGLRLAAPHFGGSADQAFTVQLPQLSRARFNFLWPAAMAAAPQWTPPDGSPKAGVQWDGLKERDDRLARDLTLRFLNIDFPAKAAGLARLTVPAVTGIYGLGIEQELRLFFNDAPLMPAPRAVPLRVRDEAGAPLAARLEISSPQTANELTYAYSDKTGVADLNLLPETQYRIRVSRGYEFAPQEVPATATDKEVTVVLKRAVARWPGWYAGDDHAHTLLYDGTHTPAQVVEAARAAGLDWLTLTEHGHSESIERAERANAEAAAFNAPGRFLVLPGMEYTGPLYHANILGGVIRVPEKSALPAVIAAAEAADTTENPVTIKLNHPSLGKTAADQARQLKELPLIELWNSNEPEATDLWWEMLNKGMRTFAETSSDSHHRENLLPGKNRTYIYLGDQPLTAGNIIRALREGRSFLSRGAVIDFTLNGARPGATVPAGPITISLKAESARPIEAIEIIRNGVVLQSIPVDGATKFTRQIQLPAAAGWYLARVTAKGEKLPLALTNPVRVQE